MELLLDTSAQLRKATIPKGQEKLRKRARRVRYKQDHIERLKALDSPLHKMYVRADFCATEIIHQGDKLTTEYCNSRCCSVCNSIRTAKLIEGYSPVLDKLKEPQMITLTYGQRVKREGIRPRTEAMNKTIRQVFDTLRKRGIKAKGIRKTEIASRETDNTFHVHFHLIIEGAEVSKLIVSEWLKRATQATRRAQDIRAFDGNYKELFKYVTKEHHNSSPENQDAIYKAMYGKRIFQPFGGIKKVSEEIEVFQVDSVLDWLGYARYPIKYTWIQEAHDWIDLKTGVCLSGYHPSQDPKPKIDKGKRKELRKARLKARQTNEIMKNTKFTR